METFETLIAGAGPVGLSLALGLARQGARSLVIEKKTRLSPHSRALVVHARTLEIFREWGVVDRFLSEGNFLYRFAAWSVDGDRPLFSLDFAPLGKVTGYPGALVLHQSLTEKLLLEAVRSSGRSEVRFATELVSFEEREGEVEARVRDASGEVRTLRAKFLVGCDGAHSSVRGQLGWPLEGTTYPAPMALADVRVDTRLDSLPWPRYALSEEGISAALKIGPGLWRILTLDPLAGNAEEVTRSGFWDWRLRRLFGDVEYERLWESPFQLHRRLSPHLRRGRIFLAGDAAHLNSPAGGQGMNTGIHDAHNLAWKLARALQGTGDTERLLASYEPERRYVFQHSVGKFTDRLTRLLRGLMRWRPVRAVMGRLLPPFLGLEAVRARLLPGAAMLKPCYPPGLLVDKGWPAGHRAPDGTLGVPGEERVRLLERIEGSPYVIGFGAELPELPDTVRALVIPRLRSNVALWKAWRARPGLVAVVRPDGFVGWHAWSPDARSLREGIAKALAL